MEENSLEDMETGWGDPLHHTMHLALSPLQEHKLSAIVVAASRYSDYNLAESMKLQI